MRAHLRLAVVFTSALLGTGCMTESYLRRGDAASAAGRPEEALGYYERVYRSSSTYRSDPLFQQKMQHTRVEALLAKGRRELAAKQWDAALGLFSQALAIEPSSGLGQQLQAEARHGAAESALASACKAADEGRLADAKQFCAHGLTYEPNHTPLLQAQRSLSPEAPGQAVLEQVARLVEDKRWPQADASLGALLESYPYHLAARSRRATIRRELAEASRLMGVAKTEIRNGDLLAAEKHLGELLRRSPHHSEARSTLASVERGIQQARSELAEAQKAEKNGRVGLALQHLRAAEKLWGQGVPGKEIGRLQGRLRELYPVQVSWEARGDGAQLLRAGLLDRLGTGTAARNTASYQLVVQASQGPGVVDTAKTERLQHQYVTRQMLANPELPALREDVHRWEREERLWRNRYDDAVRELRRAQNHIPADDPKREQILRRLSRQVVQTKEEWRDADRAWEQARHRLLVAPATVMVDQTFAFPYVRRTLRKTLMVSASAVVKFAGNDVTASTGLSRSAMSEDTVIDGANPGLGLKADPLSLASDQSLAVEAGNALAEDLAAWAWEVARKAWAGQLSASAEQLEQQGKTLDAVELRMAAEAYGAAATK